MRILPFHPRPHLLLSAALVGLLAACSTPELARHDDPVPAGWVSPQKDTLNADEASLKEWWKDFNDPTLLWLIDATLKNSPDLNIAAAKIAQARGLQKSTEGNLYPSVTGNAGAQRSRQIFLGPITGNSYNADFDASYELDLFGKNHDAANAAASLTQANEADYQWLRLSLIAEVTRNYIEMRAAEKQVALSQKNLTTQKETLDLVRRQHNAGGASEFDTARAELQTHQSEVSIVNSRRTQETGTLALVTLTGLMPAEIQAHMQKEQDIPGINLKGVVLAPATVLAHRPDIAAANARLTQATQLKEQQVDSVFPSITLGGMFGIGKTVVFPDPASVWSIGANLAVSLLDFGRIQGQIDASAANEVQAYEEWRKSILQAVQDVETALTNVSRDQQQRAGLAKTRASAAKALGLAQRRYREGDSSLLDVLDAQRQLIDTDSALASAESNYATSVVALYKALGQY